MSRKFQRFLPFYYFSHTYYKNGAVVRHDYGFMPVKNATRRDPRVHVAYLTTSSQGGPLFLTINRLHSTNKTAPIFSLIWCFGLDNCASVLVKVFFQDGQ